MVETGETVIAAVVAPVLQMYVVDPLAVIVTEPPTQIEGAAGLIIIVGKGFTVTVLVAVFVHPFTSVAVTE